MALTARKVETVGPGRHTDGRGLMLLVKASGSRSWVLRYQLNGRRRDLGLGSWPEVSLKTARMRADDARRQIADGIDPLDARNKIEAMTFRAASEALIESKRPGWRSVKHADQWGATLEAYAYPVIGRMDVKAIDTPEIMAILRPIWSTKPETASRVRQRIEAVLSYAATMGARDSANPARWRHHLENLLPKPSSVRAVQHFPAMPWRDVPTFLAALELRDGISARALGFTILTAARSGEVRGLWWREINLEERVWTIPGDRMKAGKEHRVPLSEVAVTWLGVPRGPDDLVFPGGRRLDRPLSDMSLTAVLRRMELQDITVHGFRSSFRDWAGETTPFPREVIEAALAHRLRDKAEAAYARGDLFTKRRDLMEAWASYLNNR